MSQLPLPGHLELTLALGKALGCGATGDVFPLHCSIWQRQVHPTLGYQGLGLGSCARERGLVVRRDGVSSGELCS